MKHPFVPPFALVLTLNVALAAEDERHLVEFEKVRLTEEYFAEGAATGDFNRDGRTDVVCGPLWFEGPSFEKKHRFYAGKAFPNDRGYSDNFFSYVHDFSGDGWDDVLVVGLPGTPAFWYENSRTEEPWRKRLAFPAVDNEAPVFDDLTGDGKPELICTFEGRLGYASWDPSHPGLEWTWHPVSAKGKWHRYSHGLGIGDVDGDGRKDFLMPGGWWKQPPSLDGDPDWKHHPFRFCEGGAQIWTDDVDGDGDSDVITSLRAHAWGLSWFEHVKTDEGEITFEEHRIMGERPDENPFGVAFSQLHAVDLKDIDGDGLRDIVTGKCYWAHNGADPGARDPAVLYWFQLLRTEDGAGYVPHLVDDDSGVGRQVNAVDVNDDGLRDIVCGNKKGTFVFLNRARKVSLDEWREAQPKPRRSEQGEDDSEDDSAAAPEPLFSSDVITARTRGHAVDIDVDITGAREIYLVATDAGDGIACDFANWAHPRFVTPEGEVKITELEWESVRTSWGEVRIGRNAEDGPLRIDGERYRDALGTHANSILAYDVPEGATRFRARAGLDTQGTDEGCGSTVRFSVYTEEPRIEVRRLDGEGGDDEDREEGGDEEASEESLYGDAPYWYKPGHPLDPAEAASVETAEGFVAERILTVPREMGSWTALTVGPAGRLIAAAQHRRGLFRITPPEIGDATTETKVERLRGTANEVGWSHGLLRAFDSLYVMVAEEGSAGRGIHRLRDTDGDDQFDTIEHLVRLKGSGEHGPHDMVVSPDGEWIYVISGNGTRPPRRVKRRRTVRVDGVDHLMPPGFDTTRHATAGWVARFDPEGKRWELIASGLRNSYDLAFNRNGDLFTFDSDMEWDLGTPWYRPTRICHLVSGGEFGWRRGTGKWPEYYPDSVRPVVDIGPSSPTGLTFGYGARFPARYQRALYACDWTFGTIHAVHLEPDGAGYRATVEEFVGGRALPVTDAVIGRDGAFYFVVGGRKLTSALYRVRYAGDEPTTPADTVDSADARELRALRRRLESFHGRRDGAVEAAWPYLGHADPEVRFAARIAIEHQPVRAWRKKALSERDVDRRITALLALARQGDEEDQRSVIEALGAIEFAGSPDAWKIALLRIYELAFARGGDAEALAAGVVRRLDRSFPDPDGLVSRELARLLCFLRAPDIVGRIVDVMEADAGHPETLGTSYFARNDKYGKAVADMLASAPLVHRMHLAQMLIWVDRGWTPDLRKRYFELVADGMAHSGGGHQYRGFWERTRKNALKKVPRELREEMAAIRATDRTTVALSDLPKPKGPGREWTTEAVLAELGGGLRGRDFDNGERMFAAATCIVCHRVGDRGGTAGPRLTSLGARFTLRDIVETLTEPNKAVSDQYRVVRIIRKNGTVVSGRVSFRESGTYHLMPDMMDPGTIVTVRAGEIVEVEPLETSPMPAGLLDPLSREEVLDLIAYLVSSGDPEHPAFRR